jgi:hypothetical protein
MPGRNGFFQEVRQIPPTRLSLSKAVLSASIKFPDTISDNGVLYSFSQAGSANNGIYENYLQAVSFSIPSFSFFQSFDYSTILYVSSTVAEKFVTQY